MNKKAGSTGVVVLLLFLIGIGYFSFIFFALTDLPSACTTQDNLKVNGAGITDSLEFMIRLASFQCSSEFFLVSVFLWMFSAIFLLGIALAVRG